MCLELWHACAGPVYLPEGHLEHIGKAAGAVAAVPAHVFCRVVDVNLQVRARAAWCSCCTVSAATTMCSRYLTERACSLQADPPTDEVYAQVSLVVDDEVPAPLI